MFWVAGRLMTKLWPGVTESTVAPVCTPVPDTLRPTSLAVTAASSTSVPLLVLALLSILLIVSVVAPVLVAGRPEMVNVCAATLTLLIVREPEKRLGFELVTVRLLSARVMFQSVTVVDPDVVRTGRAFVLASTRRIVSETPLAVCVAARFMMKLTPGVTETIVVLLGMPVPITVRPTSPGTTAVSSTRVPLLRVAALSVRLSAGTIELMSPSEARPAPCGTLIAEFSDEAVRRCWRPCC